MTDILICEGLPALTVLGVRRSARSRRQGLERGEKGEKEARKEEMVDSGMVIVAEGWRLNGGVWRGLGD